jgi:hypothetical protein
MVKLFGRVVGVTALVAAGVLVFAASAGAAPAHMARATRIMAIAVKASPRAIHNTPTACDQCTVNIIARKLSAKWSPNNIVSPGLWDGVAADCTNATASFFFTNTSTKWGETVTYGGSPFVDLAPGTSSGACSVAGFGKFQLGLQNDTNASIGKILKIKIT